MELPLSGAGGIKVIVIEGVSAARDVLVRALEGDAKLRVVGVVSDAAAALNCAERTAPDVVVIGIYPGGPDARQATQCIMQARALPVVVCLMTSDPGCALAAAQSVDAGALASVELPSTPQSPDFARKAEDMRRVVGLMSEVPVVRRWSPVTPRDAAAKVDAALARLRSDTVVPVASRIEVVGIGVSTGGPGTLQPLLAALPEAFPVPILIVQHMAPGFIDGFASWLARSAKFPVALAEHGAIPQPGHAYLAPDDVHMGLLASGRIGLQNSPPEGGLRPAVSYLFRSLAEVCGARAVGVLLTGMGRDGAVTLKMMRDRGAVTIAQDRESSVVHGMPGEAIALDAATLVLPVDRISKALAALVAGEPVGEERR